MNLRRDPEKQRAWQNRSARRYSKRRTRDQAQRDRYDEARRAAIEATGGRCVADGLHHPDCTGWATVTHHILPRERGGLDERDNLAPVWGGLTGADGCHGRIHSRPAEARSLGLLR